MNQGFWTHFPKRWWQPEDWAEWEKAGKPKVPPHLDLQPLEQQEIGNSAVFPPPGPQSTVTLFPRRSSRREATSARSRAVDRWLEKRGVR